MHLLLEPGEPGSGLQFHTACSEDVLDRNWQRLILTHLEEKRHRGVLTGAEITDMRITLLTGRAHIKHTEEETSARLPTGHCVRGCERENAVCWSLIMDFAWSFLQRIWEGHGRFERKCCVFDPPQTQKETAVLTGKGPVVNLRDYQREVTAYTRGRGRLSLWVKDYEPVIMRKK
mgnify:CR=1 FL=1